MHIPPAFAVDDPELIRAMIARAPLAVLITTGEAGLAATHLPMILTEDGKTLRGHLARGNSQQQSPGEALVIFGGPAAYVSPSWYASKAEHGKVVPTWNYTVVHAYGRLEAVQDQAWLLAHVSELSDQQEAPYAAPWSTADAPEAFLGTLTRGIVGLKFAITRLEAKAKMSQNREERDRAGVVEGLAERAHGEDADTAALVEKHRR
jgi:transcriptional regulator